jgi:predicted alpha/beta-hydrolase family hydrolase
MSESVTIAWEGGTVTGRFVDAGGSTGVLFAHGAGLGQDHEWMVSMRDGLAAAGIPVLTFNYPYMEAGRKAPNPARILLACHRAALDEMRSRVDRVVLAGKSMGGRMGSHVAADGEEVAGLVFYGYPLVVVGKTEPRDVSHLAGVGAPMLFVQGTRDRLAPIDLIASVVAALPDANLHVVVDGDHSFRVLKRTGRDPSEVIEEVIDVTAEWVSKL